MGKRPICKSCSNYLSPWGKTALGKKRYRCKLCGVSRIYHSNKTPTDFFKLFRQYVLWGLTYEVLSALSGYSIPHLAEKFHQYLDTTPPESNSPLIDQSSLDQTYLLIDGLWFGRWFVLMVYRQSKNLTILHISQMGREVSSKISKDLKTVQNQYIFSGVVSDGGTGIVSAIDEVYPHLPHQRCLAHLHREATNALGRYPKDDRVKLLKQLADHLWLIESRSALSWWRKQLKDWIKQNWDYLQEYRRDETGKWWYIHKGVRKSVRILLTAPDYSFTFLTHHLMPKTTNEIEAQFGHLGKRWLAHRGLKRHRWTSFLNWFVYLYNQDKLSQSNSKKAVKNNTKS